MTARHGNAAIILMLLIAVGGAGALYASPDMAQQVLPGQLLQLLPQFEHVETERSCDTISTLQGIATELGSDASEEDAQMLFCADKCDLQGHDTAATYCSGEENTLNCVCRTEDSSNEN